MSSSNSSSSSSSLALVGQADLEDLSETSMASILSTADLPSSRKGGSRPPELSASTIETYHCGGCRKTFMGRITARLHRKNSEMCRRSLVSHIVKQRNPKNETKIIFLRKIIAKKWKRNQKDDVEQKQKMALKTALFDDCKWLRWKDLATALLCRVDQKFC